MFRTFVSVLLILISRFSIGQISIYEYDTLTYKHSTLGSSDTFDLTSRYFSSSFLFPNDSRNDYIFQSNQLFYPGNSIYGSTKFSNNKLKFSALPHIGFGYTLGSQSTQKLDFDYEQAFKNGVLVNASINNFKTDGFFRNTGAQNSIYNLALARNTKLYSFELRATTDKAQRNFNGGIQNDTLVETISPDLIPVWKENAQSIHRNSTIKLSNIFSLINDSTKHLGFLFLNEYNRKKRFYFEQDSISTLYSLVNLDSTRTNDSLLLQAYNNNLVLFYKNKIVQLQTGLSSSYWNYRAFDYGNDTLEIGIFSQLDFKLNKLNFHQRGNFNLFGAANGFYNSTSINGNILGFEFNLLHNVTHELPLVFQRFFYSNNTNYKTVNLEKQWFQKFKLKVGRSFGKQIFDASLDVGQFKNVYQFDSQQGIWRNELNASKGIYQQISMGTKLNWRWLNCHLNYQFTAIDESKRFTPSHLFDTRLFVKGGIFKAKKLKALAGVDIMLTSSYKRLNFIPQMTVFDLENSSMNPTSAGFMNLAAFASFEVETFRLFIRMDNLSYFWQNRQIELINGYAFPSTQMKVGITWDFWN